MWIDESNLRFEERTAAGGKPVRSCVGEAKMRICILSSLGDLMSKDTGASVRIYALAKNLASFGNQVHIIIPNERATNECTDGVMVHGMNGICPRALLKFFCALIRIERPTSLFFYDLGFVSRVKQIIRDSDIVQIEQQSASGLLIPVIKRVFKKPLVLDCHDTFQALRVRHTSIIRKILETFLEKIAYKNADVVITVSEREKEFLTSYGIESFKVKVIPNGVDTEAFNGQSKVARVKERYGLDGFHTVVFVGNMGYLPNREAAESIALVIAPRVQKEIKNTKFLVVGRTPSKIELPNLMFAGVVENVAEVLAASDVAVAPLLHGSGTRLKVLEYFSCGLPVVSTTVGVEGLDVESGVNALIEDDMNEFATRVVRLLNDKAMSIRLGEAARELVVNRYDWKKIAEQLNVLYDDLLTENRQKPKNG